MTLLIEILCKCKFIKRHRPNQDEIRPYEIRTYESEPMNQDLNRRRLKTKFKVIVKAKRPRLNFVSCVKKNLVGS